MLLSSLKENELLAWGWERLFMGSISGAEVEPAPDGVDYMVGSAQEADPLDIVHKIIPIAPGSKFIMIVPDDTEIEAILDAQQVISDWWQGDEPFLLIGDQWELVRVDEEEVYELVDCGAENCPGHKPGKGVCDGHH